MKFPLKKGFTLIELLVVVAIIGVLASVVLSALGDARAKARDARRESDIKTIQNALELYYINHGQYPSSGNMGGPFPNVNYAISAYSSWNALENILGVQLPRDPVNQTGGSAYSDNTTLSYTYLAYPSTQHCSLQGYILVYNKEKSQEVGSIYRRCDGSTVSVGTSSIVQVSPQL